MWLVAKLISTPISANTDLAMKMFFSFAYTKSFDSNKIFSIEFPDLKKLVSSK